MKLLLDQNLSPKLVAALRDAYPDSAHVQSVGLDRAPDASVWEFARTNGFVIITKDSDFYEQSLLFGFPPKVVWIRLANCTTESVRTLLLHHCDQIQVLVQDDNAACLILL